METSFSEIVVTRNCEAGCVSIKWDGNRALVSPELMPEFSGLIGLGVVKDVFIRGIYTNSQGGWFYIVEKSSIDKKESNTAEELFRRFDEIFGAR